MNKTPNAACPQTASTIPMHRALCDTHSGAVRTCVCVRRRIPTTSRILAEDED